MREREVSYLKFQFSKLSDTICIRPVFCLNLNAFSFGFPGSQPVSLDNDNIRLLQERPYKVSWKADGTRYMMLIDGKDQVGNFVNLVMIETVS